MNVPSIKKALKAGRPVFGAWLTLGHPSIAEVMAGAGFDWLAVDMEHSAVTVAEAQALIHAAESAGAAPFVRVTHNEPAHIKRLLDMGARGIIVPMVMDAEQARAAVDAAYYPPQGKRGVGLARAQGYGFTFKEYEARHRRETMVVVQIEHIRAVENLEEILSVPGVDAFLVGPYDLSGSLGVPGQFEHPKVREAMKHIHETAKKLGVPAGFHSIPPSGAEAKRRLKEGYRFLAVSLDTLYLGTLCRDVLAECRGEAVKERGKVLVSTASFAAEDPAPLRALERAGYGVVLNPHGRKLTAEEAAGLLDGCVGVVAGTETLDARVIEGAAALKVISRCGAGLDSVDLAAAARRGVRVCNTPEAPRESVAELALTLILNVLRGVSGMDAAMHAGRWTRVSGGLLKGKTVGLVGMGRVGRRVAELLAPFSPKLLACESRPNLPFFKRHGVKRAGLAALLKASDVVSLHVTLDASTRRLMGPGQFALMKRGAVFINTARGELVDEAALAEALASGKLAGAGLDVFNEEPYKGPLSACPGAVLTPHIGSFTREGRRLMEIEAVDNLLKGLREASRPGSGA